VEPGSSGVGDGYHAADPCTSALRGDVGALRALLSAGLCPDTACDEGWSLVELAASRGQSAVVELLLAHGAAPGRLHAAVAGGEPGVVRAVVAAGAQVDARDAAGFTPLHQAVSQGDVRLVTALLLAGADATLEVGDTGVLALARRGGDARLVGLLKQRGAVR
jgi:ankyrin repeat protein